MGNSMSNKSNENCFPLSSNFAEPYNTEMVIINFYYWWILNFCKNRKIQFIDIFRENNSREHKVRIKEEDYNGHKQSKIVQIPSHCCSHCKKNSQHKDNEWIALSTHTEVDKKQNIVILLHKNNRSHQCSCRLCFSGMVNTITNQGFHMVSLYNEVCIELSLQQTEFSDIISIFTHVDIYTVLDSGGGHLVSTHFEGQYIISAPKDTMDQVAIVMLLCIQRVILQLHHHMMFIPPLHQVAYHNEHNHHDHTPILRTIAPNSEQLLKKNSDNLKIQVSKKFCIIDLLTIIFTFFYPIFMDNKENQECIEEEEHELLEKGGNKREKKNSNNKPFGDDTYKTFSEDTLSILFPSLEIRPQEIVAYPATQQPVLEPILNKFSVPERAPSKHDTMAVEFLRLCTMHDYPNTNGPSLLRLAQAGFFYEGNGNELVCFSCDFRKGSWNYNDSPREIHLRMSPNCKFLSQGGDGNVPVPREDSTQDLVPLQSTPQVGVVEPDGPQAGYNATTSNNTAHLASANYSDGQDMPDTTRRTMVVKHPEYASRPARLASYANFPRHMKQHPADMTDAGFYYAGFGDCCRCYHCGIGLRNWDPEDNPWIEHARWSMECPYILKIKGQAFIDLVQEAARAAEMAQDDEDSEAEGESAANNSDSGNQEKSGASNSSPSGGPAANEIENNVAKTSEATMSKGSSDDSGFGSGSAPVAQPIKAPLRTAAAQSLIHDEKIKPKYVTAAIEDLVKAEGWGAFTKENIRKYLKIHEENRKSASSASNADPNMLKQENKELKDLTICKICLDEKVSIVFLPCGHLVSCPQCAPALTKCPICRKNIKGTVRTNLVEKSTAK